MKRFTAAAAALALTLALPCVPVFAADSTTPATPKADDSITVEQKAAGHTYAAYQIFAGSIDKEGKDDVVFSNLTWGDGIDKGAFPSKPVDPFSIPFTKDNAPQIAAILAGLEQQDYLDAARAFSPYLGKPSATTSTLEKDGNYVLDGLEPGYYLVTDTLDKEAADTAASAKILVPVDGQVTVTPKEDVPTLKKAVKVNESSKYEITAKEDTLTWTNAADYSEGDVIDYKLTVTVPSSAEYYSSYEMSITDTIEPGLAIKQGTVAVKAVDATGASADVTKDFAIDVTGDSTTGQTLTVTDKDIKEIEINDTDLYKLGQPELVITYQATLDINAVIAPEENTNTASLTYSDSPAKPDQTGTTRPVTVGVYTFEIDIEKTDADKSPLNGAGFTLYKNEAKTGAQPDWKKVASTNNEKGHEFSFKGLGSGEYKLEESTTPDGYNTMTPIEFTVQANYQGSDIMHVTLDSVNFGNLEGKHDGIDGTQTENGVLKVTIANKSGTKLPKTGSSMLLVLLAAGVLILAYGFFEKRKESRK